jgi:acetylornithine deacetylase/succinyl-diaminopimelate desuccinylase-like protein
VIFEQFRAFVAELAPPGVTVTATLIGGGTASRMPIDGPATEAAGRALRDTFGRDPLFILAGGSIPVAASFERMLGLPVLLLGFTNPDDNAHAPNESMVLDNYERGIRAVCRYWDELATTPLRTRPE